MKDKFIYILFLLPFFINAQTVGFQMSTESAQLTHKFQTLDVMGGGVAFFDFNNDYFEDVYLTGGDLPDQLFKNNGDGTFENVTQSAGIEHPFTQTKGVVTGDLDNDGYRDIIITTNSGDHSLLYRNNGDGTFTDQTSESGIHYGWDIGIDDNKSYSPVLGDVNLDGYLDVYICNWVQWGTLLTDSITNEVIGFNYHGASNRLYINNGDMTFSEVSNIYEVTEEGCSLAAVFSDFDNDRDVDILVANDFGLWDRPDALYRNDFPEVPFSEESANSGFDSKLYGMGIGVGDYDQDGDLDYYKTSIGSAVLMQNQMDGTFKEVAEDAGVIDTYVNGQAPYMSVHWGAGFADFDNDTWLDLVAAKGRVGFPNLFPSLDSMPDQLWHNLGDGTFEDANDWFDLPNYQMARGLSYADYDNDGDMDLLFANSDSTFQNVAGAGSAVLYQNILADGGNWLKVKLEGTINNRDALGSHIEIYVNGQSWIHEINSGGQGHNSQHTSIAHFGLGEAMQIDSLIIKWLGELMPDQKYVNLSANQFIKITEGVTDFEVIQETTSTNSPIENATFEWSVFPNPVQGNQVHLNIQIEHSDKGEVLLLNANGQQIQAYPISLIEGNNEVILETPKESAGLYFLQIKLKEKIEFQKIIIQ